MFWNPKFGHPALFSEVGLANVAGSNASFSDKTGLPEKPRKNEHKLRCSGIQKVMVWFRGGAAGWPPDPFGRSTWPDNRPILVPQSGTFRSRPHPGIFCRSWVGQPRGFKHRIFLQNWAATTIPQKWIETEAFWDPNLGRFVAWRLAGCQIRLWHPFCPRIDRF